MSQMAGVRILYVTVGLPFGPGETFIIPEILEVQRRGVDVTVVPVRARTPVVHADAKRLLPFTIAESLISWPILAAAVLEAFTHGLRTIRALRPILRSRNISILFKNLSVFPKGLWLGRLAKRLGVRHIHAHWAGTSATMAFVASEVAKVPWSFTAHRWDIDENNIVREKGSTAKFVRAIDVQGGNELAVHLDAHRDKLRVIHMGVPLPSQGKHLPSPRPPGPLRLVLGAMFVQKKGHVYAIEAVRRLSERGIDVELDLAGATPAEGRSVLESTRQLVDSWGLGSQLRFLGVLGHDELLKGFSDRRWDVALLPSIVDSNGEKEGIPVFLIEAMAAGMPVVATTTGGIPELVTPDSGELVEQKNPEALAGAIARLARDQSRRAELGRNASRRVRESFEITSVVNLLLAEMGVAWPQARDSGTSSP